ncbi:MAG: hypothetical protein ACOCXT_01705 [Candidatus Dojkabacteria bacterium]
MHIENPNKTNKKKVYVIAGSCLTVLLLIVSCGMFLVWNYFLGRFNINERDLSMNDDREVYIRVRNKTDIDFKRFHLGASFRGTGYTMYYYQTLYGNINSDKMSRYEKVHNVPVGYNEISFISKTNNYHYEKSIYEDIENLPSQFLSDITYELHFRPDKVWIEKGLVEGYYTFTISNIQFGEFRSIEVDVEITKDR